MQKVFLVHINKYFSYKATCISHTKQKVFLVQSKKHFSYQPTKMRNSSAYSSVRHKKSGSIFLLLDFSNMTNWIRLKLLTVFLATWSPYFLKLLDFLIFLHGSHGLSGRRARRTKSRGPKGLQLEVRPQRGPTLLVYTIHISLLIQTFHRYIQIKLQIGYNSKMFLNSEVILNFPTK